jgi:succinate dehydrogenase / fumarate reductase, membrane anchor subunit
MDGILMGEKDFRTPIAKARGLGSAHDGTHHWIYQRISAVALIFLGVWMLLSLVQHSHASYEEWLVWLGSPWVASGVFLFVFLTTYHACLGLQIVIEDYVHHAWYRYSLLTITKLIGGFMVILSLFYLIKIQFIGK